MSKNVIGNALQDGESLKTETYWSDIIESSSGVGEFGLEMYLAYDGGYLKDCERSNQLAGSVFLS